MCAYQSQGSSLCAWLEKLWTRRHYYLGISFHKSSPRKIGFCLTFQNECSRWCVSFSEGKETFCVFRHGHETNTASSKTRRHQFFLGTITRRNPFQARKSKKMRNHPISEMSKSLHLKLFLGFLWRLVKETPAEDSSKKVLFPRYVLCSCNEAGWSLQAEERC